MIKHLAVALVFTVLVPVMVLAQTDRDDPRSLCRSDAKYTRWSQNAHAETDYLAEKAEANRRYGDALSILLQIPRDDDRDDRRRELRNTLRDEERAARDRYSEARRRIRDEYSDANDRCRGLSREDDTPNDNDDGNTPATAFCGDGVCSVLENAVLCPMCSQDTPPENCVCRSICPQDCGSPSPSPGAECATYTRNGTSSRVCATCGDGICNAFEECTASVCNNGVCSRDCGRLYCPQDC